MKQWRYEHDNDVSFDGEDESYSDYYAVINEDGSLVARVEWESDAKLITAAPELLEVLQEIISGYEDMEDSGLFDLHCYGDLIKQANMAIAKALGE